MKINHHLSFSAGIFALVILFSLTAYSEPLPYEESRRGNYFYFNPFAHRPETPAEHWDYASALEEKGKLKNALKQFNDLINLLPNFEKPYLGRGLTYLRLKEYGLAEQDLLSATRLDPDNYKSYYYLGKLYIAKKQYSIAKNYLRKAAELSPGNGKVYYELGNIY